MTVFEPSTSMSQAPQAQFVTASDQEGYTQIRAQILGRADPDLVRVVEAWATLSRPLKEAILAIAASQEGER